MAYSILGKIAVLMVVQQMVVDTLHMKDKTFDVHCDIAISLQNTLSESC